VSYLSRNGRPIPTKFGPEEAAIVFELEKLTGYPRAEIIRRAVRLLRLEVKKRGGDVGFIATELSPLRQIETHAASASLNESAPPKKTAGK
jgi:hypothetical protein